MTAILDMKSKKEIKREREKILIVFSLKYIHSAPQKPQSLIRRDSRSATPFIEYKKGALVAQWVVLGY